MARFLLYLANLIFLLLIGWFLRRVLQQIFGALRNPSGRSATGADRQVVQGQTARDPVCGMFVSTELSHRLTVESETLHFCSRECLEKYQSQYQKNIGTRAAR